MRPEIEKRFAHAAEQSRALLTGARLFGEDIDPDNIIHVLAAYKYGIERADSLARIETHQEIRYLKSWWRK